MINNPLTLVRPHILALQPYSSARDEFDGTATVYLDANENCLGSVGPVENLHRYPDPNSNQLKQIIAKVKGVNPNQIFVGNGSDEAIDLLFRAFVEPGVHAAILLPPTYGMYQVSASINGVSTISVPLGPDFEPNLVALNACMQEHTEARLLFLCSPNNPTGNCFAPSAIEQILQSFAGIVVLDEAYIDFCPQNSWLSVLGNYPNLVIVQTLSKAYGLASARVGMAFAHPAIIGVLNKIKPPYNVSSLAQDVAYDALNSQDEMQGKVAYINSQKEVLWESLSTSPLVDYVYPSDANFLLVRFVATVDATLLYNHLLNYGIVVRNRSQQIGCQNCLRITIGTETENDQLLSALQLYSR